MRTLFFLIALFAVVVSCKKSNPTPTPPANTDTCKVTPARIAGTYIKTAVKYKASSTATEQDMFSFLQECEKDDIYELKTDSSVVISTGTAVCGGPPPPGGITNWYLTNNNTQLIFGAILKIDSFTCARLVVTETDLLITGDAQTSTYVKQ
jgi:hypothetical protein